MPNKKSSITQDEYFLFLNTLKNLRNVNRLKTSTLISSCLVRKQLASNPEIPPHEALRVVLTKVLEQMEIWSPDLAKVLRIRFWDQVKIKVIIKFKLLEEHAPRTILGKQSEAIKQFAGWFIEREKALKKAKSDRI